MDKLEVIVKAIDDKLGTNIVAIDMMEVSPIFDTFVLCTANNPRLMQAIKTSVVDACEEEGFEVKGVEGIRDSKWILIDLGDIIVHIFEGEERNAYNLEKLWSDMPRINIEHMVTR